MASVAPRVNCEMCERHFRQAATVRSSVHSWRSRSRINCILSGFEAPMHCSLGLRRPAVGMLRRLAGVRRQILSIFFGKRFRLAETVANYVCRFARCNRFPRALMNNLVAEANRAALRRRHPRANRQQIIKSCGALVTALRLCNDEEAVVLCFHFLIFEAELAAEFHAPH